MTKIINFKPRHTLFNLNKVIRGKPRFKSLKHYNLKFV